MLAIVFWYESCYEFKRIYKNFIENFIQQNWSTISRRLFRLAAVLMLFGSDVLFAYFKYAFWFHPETKVSLSAHLSGGLAGFLTGLLIFKEIKNYNKK